MKAITVLAVSSLLALGGAACSGTTTSPSTTAAASTTTQTFASVLAVHGSTTRTFVMKNAGDVKLTLATLGNGSVLAGIGVGLPATGAPCSLSQSAVTGPGSSPQIVTWADTGTYCVQVFDAGILTEDTAFSLTIEHP
jgi:hypothetical protein